MSFRSFQSIASSKVRFGFFMLIKLPSAFFSGVRVCSITEQEAVVSVPYKWFSQNPFRSTYFACQAMAAEMSTGLLALGHIYKRKPVVSMLVTGLQATFFKKAVSCTYFTCTDGSALKEAVNRAIDTGQPQVFEALSIGRNEAGEIISEFRISWSFKVKS